ncbi:Glycosyl transferase, family 9 [Corchorus capsularis]|uniref:Glycosyl transferase, family 9 n=1 Tax=Corchorus capsularis TaxID=210143 RepID=A0A1R3IT04_COCAP|nr:Glycosyl transferase, family 9 [Corchorus capsularis]
MATTLLPKSVSPFLTNPTSLPSAHFTTKPPCFSPLDHSHCTTKRPSVQTNCKKRNPWLDPFDDGEDPNYSEFGSLFTDGKQEEDPRPPDNPDNPYGFLKFPMGFTVELASLPLKIRDRGKQTYELNKNVRWANVYDPDDEWPEPAEYTDMVGLLKNRYYDMALSTKLAGLGHAAFLFMTTARDRVSYIYPNVNAAGAGLLLSQTFTPDSMNLSEGGYNMYHQMSDWLGRPFRSVPRHLVPPLRVSISRKLKEVVAEKCRNAGVEKGKYIVIHGIESDSKASMQSRGDTDSLLPIEVWAQIAKDIRGFKPLFVIPHEKERENVEEVFEDLTGEDPNIVFITTPGQLAALINDSAGVIATNTAAIQLANAREKPSIGLFCSEQKGKVFVPNAEEKNCAIVSSKTGKLKDIDLDAVKQAMQIFDVSLALV